MNLVAFSIRTKGIHNFARRLWTVFSRFGFSETRTRKALYSIIDALREHRAAPTFFIPAVILRRHAHLIAEVASSGTELGIHGYVHNDYRFLPEDEQYRQTQQAMSVFQHISIPFHGFRNPYLGWTEETLHVFSRLQFAYESNEAVLHDVIDLNSLSPLLRSGYEKSLSLFQAIPCNVYTVRPHFEGELLRIPTSIPDDEMLFDRLRITDPKEVGQLWSGVMQRVHDLGGLYTLNLHPERGILCRQALDTLLDYALNTLQSVWLARLQDIALWWKTRSQFTLSITSLGNQQWLIETECTPEATLLARHIELDQDEQTLLEVEEWTGVDVRVAARRFTLISPQAPCIGLSHETPQEVATFLQEQGYPSMRCATSASDQYALFLDMPEGLGTTREQQFQQRGALVQQVERLKAPLVHFACWPHGYHAALNISGDIDSVTIQDFFRRILEVR